MDGCGDMNVPFRKFVHRHMIEGLLIRACRLIETLFEDPACTCAALVLLMFGYWVLLSGSRHRKVCPWVLNSCNRSRFNYSFGSQEKGRAAVHDSTAIYKGT
jgi:hypothetical protein